MDVAWQTSIALHSLIGIVVISGGREERTAVPYLITFCYFGVGQIVVGGYYAFIKLTLCT